ncbi:MAG: DoxX family protein [Opitutales bacterium]|nr:DoxX family protein [Opitutales bacterium]
METHIIILQTLSGLAFLVYGTACLCFGGMKAEFERYGLANFRRWVGLLEIFGGLGLWLGFYFPILTLIASAGLTLLMIAGVAVRWRVGDPWIQMMPAAALGAVNLLLFVNVFGKNFAT